MTLEERVEFLEKRLEIMEASDAKWGILVDEQLSGHAEVMLSFNAQMRQWLEDLQEHFKSHNLDKKERFNRKRKTYKYT